ncbi:hypothetical protein IWW56_002072 [Coemansia sp. RSA 2131]|nr:hypothetical protein IWW56_002072 [Coemansia sp. RSA 2131]
MQSELGTPYVSRIDHILVPPHLLDVEHAKYGHMDVNDTFSDHKEISLYAPQTPPGKFFSRAAFRMPHNFPSDLVHNEKIEQILSEFNFTLTGRAAFEKYCKLIQDILQYARNQNRRHQNYLEHEILRLCKERMRLGNEQKGQGWLIHQDRIRVYKEQAVALAEIAGIDVQERVAQIWFKKGDRDPFWQSLITKQHMHPGIQ